MNIGLISLGCDKNRVDSENLLFKLKSDGFTIVDDIDNAEAVVINTCAFIDAAKKEAIDTIFEVARKKEDKLKYLIVAGCLAQRYEKEIKEQIPEIDLVISFNDYDNISALIKGLDKDKAHDVKFDCEKVSGRILTTPYHYAYLKIAEGCDNRCSYCAIPKIRGNYRSEPMPKLIDEAKNLVESYGVKELILVAQDTTRYGIDLYKKYAILDLIEELEKLNLYKIRLLYAYPELVTDELIKKISQSDKIAKYIDIPMQHINSELLKRMNRRTSGEQIKSLVEKIRNENEKIAIRSSFIVGFPGETEEMFNELCDFIKWARLERAGFFKYSKEEGTPAEKMSGHIPDRIKKQRHKTIETIESTIIVENQKRFLNTTIYVIYEGIDFDKQCFYGRTEYDAPEVDTKVYFKSEKPLNIGNVYPVYITKTGFNLEGKVL